MPKNTAPDLIETAPIQRWLVTWVVPNTTQGIQSKIVSSQSWRIQSGRVEFINKDAGKQAIVYVLRESFLVTLEPAPAEEQA